MKDKYLAEALAVWKVVMLENETVFLMAEKWVLR